MIIDRKSIRVDDPEVLFCGRCGRPMAVCRNGSIYCSASTDDKEVVPARGALSARLCPHCGQPMIASVPAQPARLPAEAVMPDEEPPSDWRDRPPLC